MKTIHRLFVPPPVIWRQSVEPSTSFSIQEICTKAGFFYKVAGGHHPRVVLHLDVNAIAWTRNDEMIYLVDARECDLSKKIGWILILEALAYTFMDYAARESVRHT